MQPADDLAGWIRLEQTPGVGPDTARRLLAAFGLPEQIFHSTPQALGAVVPDRIVQALLAPPSPAVHALIEQTVQWAAQSGNHVLTLADAAYPQRLLQIVDPPILLYAKGRLDLLSRPALAIVGSRNATAQGVANAEQFATALSAAGWTIVSGLALGIDTAAHRGSLGAAPDAGVATTGATIAVIGTGIDIVYPARNRSLAHQIAESGCLLSEYALGTPAIASNFPRRNRIISGLAAGVLVVEAAARSGSLITARMAAEQGRDVFAIPGSIHSALAKGCHHLIKQGAKLVESAQDILEELQPVTQPTGPAKRTRPAPPQAGLPFDPAAAADSAPSGDPVLDAMGFEPVTHDVLATRCGMESADLAAALLSLELDGRVELLPGGAYQRVR